MATIKPGKHEARRVAGWTYTHEPVYAWDVVRVLGPSDLAGYYRVRVASFGFPGGFGVVLAHESILRPVSVAA